MNFVAGASGIPVEPSLEPYIEVAMEIQHDGELLSPYRKELDLLDENEVSMWMNRHKPDVVVLAAATVGGIEANRSRPADFLLENIRIETNVIEAAWKAGARRLLFLGSSCIYPKFAEQPIKEELLLTGALEPTNAWYAIAKITGIKLCEALRLQHGFDAISLMPTNLYGTGDNYHPSGSHVLPALIQRFHNAKKKGEKSVSCWGTGKPLREFMHADDLGEACVFALENWSPLLKEAPRGDSGATGIPKRWYGNGHNDKSIGRKIADIVGFEGTINWDHSRPDGTPKKQLDVDI